MKACLVFCRVENVINECRCIPSDAPDIKFKTKKPICGRYPWGKYTYNIHKRLFRAQLEN